MKHRELCFTGPNDWIRNEEDVVKKRLLCVLLAGMLAAGFFTACGNSKASEKKESSDSLKDQLNALTKDAKLDKQPKKDKGVATAPKVEGLEQVKFNVLDGTDEKPFTGKIKRVYQGFDTLFVVDEKNNLYGDRTRGYIGRTLTPILKEVKDVDLMNLTHLQVGNDFDLFLVDKNNKYIITDTKYIDGKLTVGGKDGKAYLTGTIDSKYKVASTGKSDYLEIIGTDGTYYGSTSDRYRDADWLESYKKNPRSYDYCVTYIDDKENLWINNGDLEENKINVQDGTEGWFFNTDGTLQAISHAGVFDQEIQASFNGSTPTFKQISALGSNRDDYLFGGVAAISTDNKLYILNYPDDDKTPDQTGTLLGIASNVEGDMEAAKVDPMHIVVKTSNGFYTAETDCSAQGADISLTPHAGLNSIKDEITDYTADVFLTKDGFIYTIKD